MKIAVDLHGVADSFPEVLMPLMEALRQCGNTIIVLSGPPEGDVRNALTGLGYQDGIHYDSIASVVDFLKETEADMWQDDRGRWWTNDDDWWASKATMCQNLNVDMIIDDSHKYMPYFEGMHTKFVLIKRRQK
jgi:hypothetical protein